MFQAPILGDPLYCKAPLSLDIERKQVVDPDRVYLHALEQRITVSYDCSESRDLVS